MNVVGKPKTLPWLARRAGVPERMADMLWEKALKLAGVTHDQATDHCCQAQAMQYLLLTLGQGNHVTDGAGRLPVALALQ